MLHWKISCHLMEELPVATGRSVATAAMCVNLFPCHFSDFLSTPLSFISTFFSFPFRPRSLQTPLLLPTLLCDKLLLAVDLLVVKSAPCAGMKVGRAWRRARVFPLLFLPIVITGPLSRPTSNARHALTTSQR